MKRLLFFLSLIYSAVNAQERLAPAYPLITHDPYFSIWSETEALNTQATKHWTGTNHPLRGVLSVDGELYNFLGTEEKTYEYVLPASDEKITPLAFTENKPANNWMQVNFNDSQWGKGKGALASENANAQTKWMKDDIWVRKTFDVTEDQKKDLLLKIIHDDKATVYINGKEVYNAPTIEGMFVYIPLSKDVIKSLKPKGNVIAVHAVNTGGPSFLDFGIVKEQINKNQQVVKQAFPTGLQLNATQTIYGFKCGAIDLKLTFTSPLLMNNLDLLSRPVSYISTEVKANDGKSHDVKWYFGASTNIATNFLKQQITANVQHNKNLKILKAGTVEQPTLKRTGDGVRIDWGYLYLAAPNKANITQNITTELEALNLLTSNKSNVAVKNGTNLKLNTVIDFGKIAKAAKEEYLMLGYDDGLSIEYFQNKLRPWWNKDGNQTIENQLEIAAETKNKVIEECEEFDKKLFADALKSGGKDYADLCLIAYRQAIAAHKLVQSPSGEILFLSKENYSGGFINTVDVTYPSAPLFLIYNPTLMEGMLNAIFYFSESGKWNKPYPAHDLGHYPIANGQTYGEDMPVEESGNMVVLTAAIAKAEGNAEFARLHWKTLSTWANYLAEYGFDPANQLSTDDFAGHLARNANLSVKAIVALGGYAMLADMLGEKETATKYHKIAKDMATKWEKMTNAGDHYALTFDNMNSWSQKYNLVWDKLLNLNLFPKEVYKKEVNYYLTKQNKYGLPLDSRKTYTKSDWIIWSATLADNQKDFNALIAPILKYAKETPNRSAISDFHETTDGKRVNFTARSVVGGYFIKMLETKFQK